MLQSPELHRRIRERIESCLDDRTWRWLSEASGVPQSTLSNQLSRPRFSLKVLLHVANALEKDLSFFIETYPKRAFDDDDRSAGIGL